MIDFAHFESIVTSEGFDVGDVPLALRDSIAYTFNDFDRQGDLRYNDGTGWVEGYKQLFHFAHANETTTTDQTFCITVSDGVHVKLGLVCDVNQATFSKYHAALELQGVRQAVAAAFGYEDAVLITGSVAPGRVYADGYVDNFRDGYIIPTYATQYSQDTAWYLVPEADRPAVADIIGSGYPGDDATKRSPVLIATANLRLRVALPVEHYNADLENVATLNTSCDKLLQQRVQALSDSIDGQIETLTLAFASVADLAGNLSVFGNTVKDVATRYNSMSQYIPRP